MRETVAEQEHGIDVSIMRCPITKQGLVFRNSSFLETVDGSYAYPIKDGIFCLTADNALRIASQETTTPVEQQKQSVRDFYNDFGWKLTERGTYNDTAVWIDQRGLSYKYSNWCMRQVGAHLPRSGMYLLDAGSGAIPHPVYIEYHENYSRRICVDFSIQALQEAQKKIGDQGIYVLGDVTNLPFRDEAVDAVISNHVLYHVPADEQAKAFREFFRVIRPGGRAVVVYAWRSPFLQKLIKLFTISVLGLRGNHVLPEERANMPNLYYHAHSVRWFSRQNWPFSYSIRTFRIVSENFMMAYFSENRRSRLLVALLKALQYTFPGWCGRYGQHPAIVIFK